MRWLIICLCVSASPVWAWEFTPDPICTLSQVSGDESVVVTFDARVPEYAIAIMRAEPWPKEPVFAIRFEGPRGLTISTSRHQLSRGGTVLTVTDRGFGNVLDGLQFNHTATALTGSAALSVPLEGAAPAVEQFRACTTAASVRDTTGSYTIVRSPPSLREDGHIAYRQPRLGMGRPLRTARQHQISTASEIANASSSSTPR